jgi:hypothetical protein
MEKELLDDLAQLGEALKNDPRIIALNQAEQALMANPEVLRLAEKKDAAERAYEDCLVYHKEKDPEALVLQKALYEAKLSLDEHPISKAYSAAYIPVRDLYMQIDDILYSPFRKKSLFEGIF